MLEVPYLRYVQGMNDGFSNEEFFIQTFIQREMSVIIMKHYARWIFSHACCRFHTDDTINRSMSDRG